MRAMPDFHRDIAPDREIGMEKEVPKEMDVFYNDESHFLPEGKTFEDLTPEEMAELKNKARFDPYRPGIYQGITGLGKMF